MASFPRDLGPNLVLRFPRISMRPRPCAPVSQLTIPVRVFHIHSPRACTSLSRLFRTSAFRAAAKVKVTSKTAIPLLKTPAPSTFAEQLAAKSAPTMLYRAPSHFWMFLSIRLGCSFMVTYVVYHYWEVILHPRPGLWWFVPHMMALVCITMSGMAAFFAHGLRRMVTTIRAMPTRLVPTNQLPARVADAQKKELKTNYPLCIEVTYPRVLPFLPEMRKYALPEEVQMPFKMQDLFPEQGSSAVIGPDDLPLPPLNEETKLKEQKQEEAQLKALYAKDEKHRMTAPFRHFWFFTKKIFWPFKALIMGMYTGISRGISRTNFHEMLVQNEAFKLDCQAGGWLLDRGKALDRLTSVRQDTFIRRW